MKSVMSWIMVFVRRLDVPLCGSEQLVPQARSTGGRTQSQNYSALRQNSIHAQNIALRPSPLPPTASKICLRSMG